MTQVRNAYYLVRLNNGIGMFCYEGVECCRLLLTINISDIEAMHIGLGALERRKLDLKSRMDFWAGFIRPRSYVRTSPRLLGDMQKHRGGL